MTLNLKLDERKDVEAARDGMGRAWKGYDPNLTDQELFDQNCGVWVVGEKAKTERYATFSFEGQVVLAVELTGMHPVTIPGTGAIKQILEGRVLPEGDPAREELMGTLINSFRNPVSYIPDPPSSPRLCACGCHTPVPSGRLFVPGHDQKAIHERIAKRWGSARKFIEWFDATEGEAGSAA